MIIINNVDSQKFTFNGVEYFKNFTPVVVGNKIRVLNTYDSSIELTDAPRLYSEFEVDGVVYASVSLLQTALLPILYTRNSLLGDFLSSDITDYTDATTPLVGTELALIDDGTGFKKVAVSEFVGDLQSVTDNGNTTTNEIIAGNFVSAGSGNFGGIILNDGDLNQIADISSLATSLNPRSYNLPDKDGTVAMIEEVNSLNKSFVFTIELIDYLTVDFYAPDELKINSIQQIVNLPSIDILVNDTSYTLGNVIGRGDKITIVSDIVGVVNLKGNYE